jgi:hypothetical protein
MHGVPLLPARSPRNPGSPRRCCGVNLQADLLRLNTSVPPTTAKPGIFGLLGGDPAGFPNGRRVFDDVVSIELWAIAGVTFKLIDPAYTVDAAAGELTDGLTPPTSAHRT